MRVRKQGRGAIPRYVMNPEYIASREGQYEIEAAKEALARSGEMVEDYFPEDYGKKLPENGSWIMLLCSVDVGNPLPDETFENIHVPHLSMWYAMPAVTNFCRQVGPFEMPLTLAVIQTPQGEVRVWPHEYNVVNDLGRYLEFAEEDGLFIHFLHPETGGFDELKLFYLRSRGLSKAQAQRILLPELNNPNFCYFTFHEEYSKVFPNGTGIPRLNR
jgi:hypothetical protein